MQVGAIPPAVEKTNSTKLAPSTSRTLCSSWRLLLRSCFECWLASDVVIAEGALGWKTRTSNRDLEERSTQKPRSLMSRRLLWCLDVFFGDICIAWELFTVQWLKGWRKCDIVAHFLHFTLAMKFRSSLWRNTKYPPVAQDVAGSIENACPQAQWERRWSGCQL